ncbi:MAG: bifunctional hydroxymethylpyrimidine kinase/phosphomethylpyrimidine kinase [Acidobacteria bacterium]|nr:bifunctional hydroxymethylpyrimidine kinase/phosphomethylpyrimidine kinase [Acidobacteriota bacterium]
MKPTPVVVACGGVDPTGGAGLAQDVAFLARLGVRAAPVVTALAVQDDRALRHVEAIEASLFREQLDAARETYGASIRAIKSGLVVERAQAEAIAAAARAIPAPLVVDPVAVAGTGQRFIGGDVRRVLQPLIDGAALLLPNIAEAEELAGATWTGDAAGLLALARALAGPGRTVAVSGGHAPGDSVLLAVVAPVGEKLVEAPRAERGATHGTGCALASAAAGYIASGLLPADAAAAAHRFVAAVLASSAGVAGVRVSPEPWAG